MCCECVRIVGICGLAVAALGAPHREIAQALRRFDDAVYEFLAHLFGIDPVVRRKGYVADLAGA